MATARAVPGSTAAALPARWHTLHVLKASLYTIVVLDFILLAVVLGSAGAHRAALKTVGRDAEPGIVAAQRIKSALAGMDANAVDELLMRNSPDAGAEARYEANRTEAATALVSASEDITLGDEQRVPVRKLEVHLGDYERSMQRALDLAPHDYSRAAAAYANAATLMDTVLLPAAGSLEAADKHMMDRAYDSGRTASLVSRLAVYASGLLLCFALIIVQTALARRTRRILNPALLLATVFAVGLIIYSMGALWRSSVHLRTAKEDAFTSINALWQARAAAHSARAEESRYLLTGKDEYVRAFDTKVAELAVLPARETFASVVPAGGPVKKVDGFRGYLADELGNARLTGERDAAVEALRRFGAWLETDRAVREMQRNGRHDAALKLCLGSGAGGAFDQFDAALGRALAMNQNEFDDAVQSGFTALSGLEWSAPLLAVAVAALTALGLLPRIREYL